MRKTTARRKLQLCAVFLLLGATLAQAQRKQRIAVLSFEMGGDSLQVAEKLGAKNDLGLTLSDLLVNELASAGKVQIVERSALDKILKEQNFSNSDRLDNTTAAKIGKIAGVDAILVGSVTQFVGSSSETGYSKGLSMVVKSGAHRMQTKVSIVTTARLLDVNTGVVLLTAQGQGSAENLNTTVASGASGQQMGNPVLNEATLKAIKIMAEQLDASPVMTRTVLVARVAYKGVVADVDGDVLVLTVGTRGGVQVGDVLQVSRAGRTIKDPKTGAVLKVMYDSLGTGTVTEADDKTATVKYSGAKPVKVNDTASFAP